jgi:hypothetical protein
MAHRPGTYDQNSLNPIDESDGGISEYSPNGASYGSSRKISEIPL